MSENFYSHDLRILSCSQCGAPLHAPIGGGYLTCSYCSASHQLAARDESADLAAADAAARDPISESERYARLREQDRGGAPLPASVAVLVEGHELRLSQLAAALEEWKAARAQLGAGSASFPASERLFHLTILIAPHVAEQNRRAYLETAIELLMDVGHRHVIRCLLAREAARIGDVAAARAWLASCNPRPMDLSMDTAFRLAIATISTAEQDARGVLRVLGDRPNDVPLFDAFERACEILQVNAVERCGAAEAAVVRIAAWMRESSPAAVRAQVAAHAPLPLLAVSLPEAERRVVAEKLGVLETERAQLRSPIVSGLGWALAVTFMLMIPLTAGCLLPIVGLLVNEHVLEENEGFVVGGVVAAVVNLAVIIAVTVRVASRKREQARTKDEEIDTLRRSVAA